MRVEGSSEEFLGTNEDKEQSEKAVFKMAEHIPNLAKNYQLITNFKKMSRLQTG